MVTLWSDFFPMLYVPASTTTTLGGLQAVDEASVATVWSGTAADAAGADGYRQRAEAYDMEWDLVDGSDFYQVRAKTHLSTTPRAEAALEVGRYFSRLELPQSARSGNPNSSTSPVDGP